MGGALAYATERMHPEPLRTTLATTNELLKRNKAFLRNQMSGLLALNIDAKITLSKNCACNSTGPLNTACFCRSLAGEPKD